MKVRDLLATMMETDNFLKMRIIAEIARDYPEYENLPRYRQKEMLQKILDSEVEEDIAKFVEETANAS